RGVVTMVGFGRRGLPGPIFAAAAVLLALLAAVRRVDARAAATSSWCVEKAPNPRIYNDSVSALSCPSMIRCFAVSSFVRKVARQRVVSPWRLTPARAERRRAFRRRGTARPGLSRARLAPWVL